MTAVTIVESGGIAVTPVDSGAAQMKVVESGGIAVTVVESGGLPFVLDGYGPPTNIARPVISGDPTVGETLATTNGTWFNSPTPYTYARQWYADGAAIPGATGSTYELTASEKDKLITVGVTATNDIGDSDEALSDPAGPVVGTDSIAPVLSLPTGFQTGPTAATVGATTDEGNGTLYVVVTTSATAPTAVQIKNGQNHLGAAAPADDAQVILGIGAKTFDVTGLTASTAYYAHLMHEDAAGNQSNVVSSAQFTTSAAPDVTAPTLSSPVDTETGTTTATIGVTTNEANGTLYWFLSTSGTPPSAANLKAGTGAVQSGTQTITTTGAKTEDLTGLTAATTYYAHFLHRDAAGNDSTIASGDGFTTTALGAGELDESITPPVLSLAVGPTTYPPEFDVALDTTVAVGDTLVLTQYSDVRGTTVVDTFENTIDSSEAAANAASFTGLSSVTSGTYYWDCYVRQPDNDYSASSDLILHGAAADTTPSAFSFTDQTNVALSTVIESAEITLSGFNQPVAASITGGEYKVDAGAGYGAYTSASGTVYPGDKIKVRHTSSGANSTATNTVFTAGGVSDTFTSTTLAASVTLPTSGLLLQLDADDTATLFQTVAGATAPADGQPIGKWNDKSGGGFHLTAAADNTTRPTYRTNSGLPYLEFDGSNDLLRRLAALGMYSGGACTIIVSMRTTATPAANQAVLGEMRSSTSNNPVYSPISSVNTGNNTQVFLRNDANTQISIASPVTLALSGSDVVATITDSGSQIIGYTDGVAGTTRSYTRSGTLTLDTFSLGGWNRATPSNFMPLRIYALAIWNRVLNSTERADALTYMGAKQGRAL